MSWRRGKASSGWAAFDLDQRRKQGLESLADVEPYPSLLSSPLDRGKNLTTKKNGLGNAVLLEKPFVSVLLHTLDFPETRLNLGDSSSQGVKLVVNNSHEELTVLQAIETLEEHYPWADRSLIEDLLGGVDNNFDEASSMLKAMESSKEDLAEDGELTGKENTSVVNNGGTSQKSVDFADMKSFIEEYDKQKNKELLDDHVFCGNVVMSDGVDTNISLANMRFNPIEPEWEEEDDVYLVHRKDAMRMMRSAAHHSKAASDAYARGDHLSAQRSSRKAREEWIVAERLNAEAAKEILSIRNSKNDPWTLDLHGLHAAEAIQALKEHLQKTESSISGNPLSVFLDSSSCYEGMTGNELPSSSLKSTNLQVITGKGNHSWGQAALPAAIRSFLNENGYHYDEARPGVITVRPKFRRG